MKNSSLIIFISSLLIVILGIFIADQIGFWSTSSSGDLLTKEENEVLIGNPEELRGSSTFDEIERAFDIPAETLAQAYHFDTVEPGLLIVSYVSDAFEYLGEEVEIGTGSVRLFIYLYTGMNVSGLDEYENLPSTAVDILKEEGRWTSEIESLLATYVIEIEKEAMGDEGLSTLMEEDHDEAFQVNSESGLVILEEINGKTTIQHIIDAGMTLEAIEALMGIEIKNNNLTLRDLCDQNDLDFSLMKNEILEKLQ